MKNVALRLVPLPLLIALASCSEEGTIGRERCLGENTRCEPAPLDQGTYDSSKAKPVSSDVTREAELIWSIDLDCDGPCGAGDAQLIDDGQAGVWILDPPAALSALGSSMTAVGYRAVHVDERGEIVARHEQPLPDDEVITVYPFTHAWPDPEGGIVFARTSFLFDLDDPLPHVHYLTRVGESGFSDFVVGSSKNVSARGFSGPEHFFDALPSDDGFITVMLAADSHVVRKIDKAGDTIWRQVELPKESQIALGMASLDSGFALLTASGLPLTQLATTQWLLWFDADGNVTARMAPPFYGTTLRPAMLGLSNARVALAGVVTTFDDPPLAGPQVLDLIVLRLAADASLTGHRIVNESPLTPSVLGMAVDAEDTIYVTSSTGTRQHPRGLICALPDQGDGSCYLAPEGISPLAIATPAPSVLYALSGDALVKLELPAP